MRSGATMPDAAGGEGVTGCAVAKPEGAVHRYAVNQISPLTNRAICNRTSSMSDVYKYRNLDAVEPSYQYGFGQSRPRNERCEISKRHWHVAPPPDPKIAP